MGWTLLFEGEPDHNIKKPSPCKIIVWANVITFMILILAWTWRTNTRTEGHSFRSLHVLGSSRDPILKIAWLRWLPVSQNYSTSCLCLPVKALLSGSRPRIHRAGILVSCNPNRSFKRVTTLSHKCSFFSQEYNMCTRVPTSFSHLQHVLLSLSFSLDILLGVQQFLSNNLYWISWDCAS